MINNDKQPKRLIEVAFPLREIGEKSYKEKSLSSRRFGHISTLHVWWARRPITACRAVIFASLVPDPDDPNCPVEFRSLVEKLVPATYNKDGLYPLLRHRLLGFIADVCKFENSNNQHMLEIARKLIREANNGKPPKVIDPFSGGGSIPLEALRFDCETYASDLNPVATLILKCALEYPQRYGQPNSRSVPEYIREIDRHESKTNIQQRLFEDYGYWTNEYRRNPLATDVRYWGQRILELARKELTSYYQPDANGNIPVAYFWVRTAKCPNPTCGAEMHLIRQYWLVRRDNKKVALKPVVNKHTKTISYQIVTDNDIQHDPANGTVKHGNVQCLVCEQIATAAYLKKEGLAGRLGSKMIAVVVDSSEGLRYRLADAHDMQLFTKAVHKLYEIEQQHPDDIPREPIYNFIAINAVRYGMNTFSSLFNDRQLLTLITITRLVRQVRTEMALYGHDMEYIDAVMSELAMVLDHIVDKNSTFCMWNIGLEKVSGTFTRQILTMVWDYCELNPFNETKNSLIKAINTVVRVIEHMSATNGKSAIVSSTDAADSLRNIEAFDALITDPPYYDYVYYADNSDFFYVWLKRSVGDLHQKMFSTPLTSKDQELIHNAFRYNKDRDAARRFFENGMRRVWSQAKKSLGTDGISVIVFGHKTIEAWDTFASSLIESGWTITASWPLYTENSKRLLSQRTQALRSSIFLVCRPRYENTEIGYIHEILDELRSHIRERLEYFWRNGIHGIDLSYSAFGPALEIYSRYTELRNIAGDRVTVKEFLELVQCEANNYIMAQGFE